MCNPRRILVQACRDVCRAWHRTITVLREESRPVAFGDRVRAEVRLDESLGDAARQALARLVTSGFRGWRDEGGRAVLRLGPVAIVYDPVDGVLAVETALEDVVRAEVSVARDLAGTLQGRLEVNQVVELYEQVYADEGRLRSEAERRAVEQEVERRIEAIVAGERQRLAEDLDPAVVQRLHQQLERQGEAARLRLQARSAELLAAAEPQVQRELSLLLAETYKGALLDIAREYGGQVLRQSESAGVVELEIQI